MTIYAPAQGYPSGGGGGGISAIDITVLNGSITIVKAADEGLASTTALQDDDEFFVTVVSGRKYLVELCGTVSSGANGGFQCALGGTATWVSADCYEALLFDQSANTILDVRAVTVFGNGSVLMTDSPGGAMTYLFSLVAGVVITGNGTLVFRWAQAVSSVSNSTVRRGSYFRVTRIT